MQIKKKKLPPKYLKKGKKQSSLVIILKGMQGLKSPCDDNCMYLNQYELFASWMKCLLASTLWDEFHTKVEDIREQWPPLPWERWSTLHWKQKTTKDKQYPGLSTEFARAVQDPQLEAATASLSVFPGQVVWHTAQEHFQEEKKKVFLGVSYHDANDLGARERNAPRAEREKLIFESKR